MDKKIITWSFLAAAGEAAYIALIVTFMQNAQNLFAKVPEYLAGMTMLLVFVLSAAISGGLVLGKPVLMYFDGKKKEALRQFIATLAWMLIFLAILIAILAISH